MPEEILLLDHKKFYIRQASPKDQHSLEELLTATARFLQAAGSTQWQDVLAGQDRHGLSLSITKQEVYLCHSEKGALAAALIIRETPLEWDSNLWEDKISDPAVYLHRLMVARSFAHHGLGEEMLRFACRFALQKKIPYVRLDCLAENPFLCSFYEAAGFTWMGRKKEYALFEINY
ncbi:GNAT family N-acetyltransferase [Listeria costaricensis]|uniref:GNAT family N-acetyltransferase n=1 Tax=Listeria costaricensis TaxID=2026604 RepID=UPI000C07BB4D|nr:GNAT family N-acetyltransferase [Listeria costaricensis]